MILSKYKPVNKLFWNDSCMILTDMISYTYDYVVRTEVLQVSYFGIQVMSSVIGLRQ